MGADQARKAMIGWVQAINRKDLDSLGRLVANDFVSHYMGTQGREAYLQFFQGMFEAFPDFRGEVLDTVADDVGVALRARWTGTHQGEFNGIPATGRRITLEAVDWTRVNTDGLFTEHWGYADNLSLMRQLGVIPE